MKSIQVLSLVPLFFSVTAQAALITDASSIIGTTTVINFSGVAGTGVAGPVDLGSGVDVTGTVGGLYFNWNGWGLNGNGTWNSGRDGYAGINDPGMITFYLDQPISAIGVFMNYSTNASTCTISVLGNVGQVLESYNLVASAPVSTPGATNDGAFRGIQRGSADVYGFQVSGGYPAVDNLTFATVPEPGMAALGLLGCGVLLGRRKR